MSGLRRLILAPCLALSSVGAFSQTSANAEWRAVEAEALADMRGGFGTESGLKISFGIERSININGELASTMRFSMDDVGKLAGGKTTISVPANMVELIQNGPGNVFQAGALPAAATFIQNSLNDQTIQSMTVINATTNSLEILKSMNSNGILSQALLNAAALR